MLAPAARRYVGRIAIEANYARSGGPLVLRAIAFGAGDTIGYILGACALAPGGPDEGKFTLALRKVRGRG